MATPVKRALVLSGGGMFGAYQAGVWHAIHDVFAPDLVVGASVGALNGYLIACGSTPKTLIDRWLSLDEAGKLRWKWSPRLTEGMIDCTTLNGLIQEMCQSEPRCEYALVATETRTCRQRLFCWPEVNWRHIAASCGVPLFLAAHRIDGILYSDGGLVDPLPLWAALKLGATEIIAVDVLKHRPLAVRAVVSALQAYAGYRRPDTGAIQVIEISPTERLGSARDSMYWSRSNADRWIELGRKDGLAVIGPHRDLTFLV